VKYGQAICGTNKADGNDLFNGLYGDCEVQPDSDWINVCNFRIIEKCQEFHPSDAKIDMLIKAVRQDIKDNNSEVLAELISEGYIINNNREYKVGCLRGYLIVPNSLEKLGMYAVLNKIVKNRGDYLK
jgi:hypothetical protein